METQTEERLVDVGVGRGWGGWRVTWRHATTIWQTASRRESAVCLRELTLGLYSSLEGWDGVNPS